MSSPSVYPTAVPTGLMCAPSAAPTMPAPVDSGSFISTVLTNLVIGTIMVLIFSRIRSKTNWCHRYRLHQNEDLVEKVPEIPYGFLGLGWIKVVWSITQEDLIKAEVGVDAIVYLRFLKLAFRYFAYILPIAVLYMVLYKYGDTQDDEVLPEMDEFTLANVESGSPLLFVYCLGSFFLTGLLCRMLFKEYESYVDIRHTLFLTDKSDADILRAKKSALVQNIPKDAQDESGLKTLFQSLFPETYESSVLCYDTRNVDKLLSEREAWFRKLERAQFDLTNSESNVRPLTRSFPLFGEEVDAIQYFSEKIEDLNKQIDQLKEEGLDTTANGFVTFNTFDAVATATQMKQTMTPFVYDCRLAMSPDEANWRNLVMIPSEIKLRCLLGGAMVFFLVIFWTIPVALASTLTNLQSLEAVIPGLDWLLDNLPALASFLSGFLPGLALLVFKAILPKILIAISTFKGFESQAWIERDTFCSFFYFQLFNFYLIAAIGGAVIGSLGSIMGTSDDDPCADTDDTDLTDPQQLADLLATNLPRQWMTFFSYIALQSLASFPILLTDVGSYIVGSLKLKYLAKTPHEQMEATKPLFMRYHVDYPNQLLVFMIGCAFAPLAPILIIFIALYFAIASLIYTYRLVYWLPKQYDGGGSLFPLVFDRIIVGIIVGQVTLMGVLGLKAFPYAVPFMVIQIVCTIMFKNYTNNAFKNLSNNLTREEIVALDSSKSSDDTVAKEEGVVCLYLAPGLSAKKIDVNSSDPEL